MSESWEAAQKRQSEESLRSFNRTNLLTAIDGFLVSYEEYQAAMESYYQSKNWHEIPSIKTRRDRDDWADARAKLLHETIFRRWFLLNAANQILRYRGLAIKAAVVPADRFKPLEKFQIEIKRLRDLNEHADEYYQGKGRRRAEWTHVADGGVADATSIVDGRIGNLLNPADLYPIVKQLREDVIASNTDWDGPAARQQRYDQELEYQKEEIWRSVQGHLVGAVLANLPEIEEKIIAELVALGFNDDDLQRRLNEFNKRIGRPSQ